MKKRSSNIQNLSLVMSELFPDVLVAVKKAYKETKTKEDCLLAAENALFREKIIFKEKTANKVVQAIINYFIVNNLKNENVLREWRDIGGMQ